MVAPLIGGLGLFGIGEGLLVTSRLGATPWTVFAEGLGKHLHISIGWSTALISVVVLLGWIPFREKPGIGTVANVIVIASALNETVALMPTPHAMLLRAGLVLAGIEAIGLGSALYLTTALGPGPRDGLMTSMHRQWHISVVYVRSAIEATVLVAGVSLGGVFGVGTFVFAASIGFCIGLNLGFVERLVRSGS
jgi:uncharacterized membrane protein YczE